MKISVDVIISGRYNLVMKFFLSIILLVFLFGCGHIVSSEIRDTADKDLTPAALFKNLEAHKGKVIILGGVIVGSKNTNDGTYIEVIEKPLNSQGLPIDTDESQGRFLILYDGYLDTAIYAKGREITVAGEVLGKKTRTIGEMLYSYPLIKSKKLYLLEKRRTQHNIPVRFGIGILHVL